MSKKSNQKPVASNTGKAEVVAGIIETKAQEPLEEPPVQEQIDAATESGAVTVEESAEQNAEPESVEGDLAVEPSAAEETDEPDTAPPAATSVVAATPPDLAVRLTKSVSAMLATGAPEVVHALHRAEMIVGDLKNALPAAIDAADESLKADLQTLLALL